MTEAIGAIAALIKLDRRREDEDWYRRLWIFANRHLIDHQRGGWYPELGVGNRLAEPQFLGKPDIYHSIQAALFPLSGGLSRFNEGLLSSGPDRSILAT